MKKLIAHILISCMATLALGMGTVAYAADNQPKTDFVAPSIVKPSLLPGPSKDQVTDRGSRQILTESVLPKFAINFIGFIGGIALLFVIIGGVRYTMVYGNEEAAEKAKNQIIYALVGFLIALLSYTIVSIISNVEFTDNTSTGAAQGPALPPDGI